MTEKTPNDQTVDQFYTSIDGKVWPEETWVTEDGRHILVKDLEPEHARNIIRMILRNQRIQLEQYEQLLASLELIWAQAEAEEAGNSGHLLN